MLKLFDSKSHLRGEDFQLPNGADNIATTIWDIVFPALERGMKTTLSLYLFF